MSLIFRSGLRTPDREILALCPARPDATVTREDVRRFFAAHYDDKRIQAALSGTDCAPKADTKRPIRGSARIAGARS